MITKDFYAKMSFILFKKNSRANIVFSFVDDRKVKQKISVILLFFLINREYDTHIVNLHLILELESFCFTTT